MAFVPAQWLHHFVLPLVAGGDVRVREVIGARERKLLRESDLERDESAQRIAEARHAIVSELVMAPPEPTLDDEALRLAAAMQNLLFLLHPGSKAASVTQRRLRAVSAYATQLATLPLPDLELED
ncbi:MAG: hypothetical protein ACXVAN_09790, partial [Polyangia bacterium]